MELELNKPIHLVRLNELLAIPSCLYDRWKARTGTNPLVTAKQYARHCEFQDNVISRLDTFIGMPLLLASIALFDGASRLQHGSPAAGLYSLGIGGVLAVLTLVLFLIRPRLKRKHPRPEQDALASCYSFMSALRMLVEWTGGDIDRLPRQPHQLEQLATGLLVMAAKDILVFAANKPSSTADAKCFALVGEEEWRLSEDFRSKYDTLRDLGLLVKTGYDPYYKAAQQLLAEGKVA